jgi:hypothetical protein
MAQTATLLTSSYDNVNRVSYPFASVSPAANSLLLVFVSLRASSTAGTPTISDALSGGSLTWSTVDSDLDGISSTGVFVAQCGATPGSGVITLAQTGGDATHIGAVWFVIEITGHNSTTPVAQFKFVGGDGSTSAAPTGTLDNAIGGANNRVFCFVCHRANQATTPRTNWTELGDVNNSGPNYGGECQWRDDGTNETTFGASWSGSVRYAMHGVEIAAASGGAVALAGQSDGTSTTTGALAVAIKFVGTSDGVSTTTGALSVAIPLAGQSDGVSTATGTLSLVIPLAGTSDGTSTTAADMVVAVALAGTADGVSTTTGAMAVAVALAGQSDGVSTTTADLSVTSVVDLAGQSDGVSTTTGALAVAVALSGASDGSSTATGALAVSVALAGASDGTSTATADLLVGVVVDLAGSSDGVSGASGTLGEYVQEGLVSVRVRVSHDFMGREHTKYSVRSR